MSGRSKHVDERYFEWLYEKVGQISNRNPARSYWLLCEKLHRTIFYGFIANDHNRAEDGKELREEFVSETGLRVNNDWMELDCSMLEMLIALSRRASYQSYHASRTPFFWFWRMIQNLGLKKYTDEKWHDMIGEAVDRVLDSLVRRTYDSDGRGGLFPLKNPHEDQTDVEIWYQLAAYLGEND